MMLFVQVVLILDVVVCGALGFVFYSKWQWSAQRAVWVSFMSLDVAIGALSLAVANLASLAIVSLP